MHFQLATALEMEVGQLEDVILGDEKVGLFPVKLLIESEIDLLWDVVEWNQVPSNSDFEIPVDECSF